MGYISIVTCDINQQLDLLISSKDWLREQNFLITKNDRCTYAPDNILEMFEKQADMCTIKFSWGRGGDTFKTPSPTNNFYSPPVLRCF